MSTKLKTSALSATLALATIAAGLAATGTTASAALCKPNPTAGAATHPIRAVAISKAKNVWSKRVQKGYGKLWSNWSLAQNKKVSATKVGIKWAASVGARACAGPGSMTLSQ